MPTVANVSATPDNQSTSQSNQDNNLLGSTIRGPIALLLFWTLPITILSIINTHSHWLVWSEMDKVDKGWATTWIALLALNLIASLLTVQRLHKTQKALTSLGAILPLFLQIGHLVLTTLTIDLWMPAGVQDWMLPPDRVLFQQWSLSMIPAFYAALVVSGFNSNKDKSTELKTTLAIVIGVPLIFFLISQFIYGVRSSAQTIIVPIFLSALALGTVALGVSVLRLLTNSWKRIFDTNRKAEFGATVLIALVLPLAGLALNSEIEFPVDFQHPWIYAMTVINALVLCVPTGISRTWNQGLWIARCLTFPFTAYFFIVFLPFLPLSIPAMIAVGAGFLILTPTALFVFHLQKLYKSYQSSDTHPASYWVTGVLAVSIIPGFFVVEANLIKGELDRSMDFVLNPDFTTEQSYSGSPFLAAKSFEWLNDFKNGVNYPIISSLRMNILFNGLILPDRKLKPLYEAFTGEKMSTKPSNSDNFLGTSSGSIRSLRRARTPPPLPRAKLQSLKTEVVYNESKDLSVTRLQLDMQSGPSLESEFKATLSLPEGTWITGFALYIGDERVEGRLFEKSSALWVYRMIRDDDRSRPLKDPATLTLDSEGNYSLQVFPFSPEQVRRAEIDIASLRKTTGSLDSQNRRTTFSISDSTPHANLTERIDTENGTGLLINTDNLPEHLLTTRQPFLEILIDRSNNGLSSDAINQSLRELRERYSHISHIRLSLVNLESQTIFKDPLPWEQAIQKLTELNIEEAFPLQFGFLLENALGKLAMDNLNTENSVSRYPVWVILNNGSPVTSESSYEPFERSFPDSPSPVYVTHSKKITTSSSSTKKQKPVYLIKVGNSIRTVAKNTSNSWLRFPNSNADDSIEIYDATQENWIRLDDSTHTHNKPALGQIASFDILNHSTLLNPASKQSLRNQLVALSKRLNVLGSSTAFIVLENDAQWKILEEKEQQKLSSHNSLEFDETPEPSFYLLLAIAATFLLIRGRTRKVV